MKTKNILFVTGLIFSQLSNASSVKEQLLQSFHQKGLLTNFSIAPKDGPNAPPSISPTRITTGTATLTKTTSQTDPQGKTSFVTTVVCRQPIQIPVYDGRQSDASTVFVDYPNQPSCWSTFQNSPINYQFYAAIWLIRGQPTPMDAMEDFKTFGGGAFTSLQNAPTIEGQLAIFRDLFQKEVIFVSQPANNQTCSNTSSGHTTCSVQYPEVFGVIIDMQDNVQ